MFEEYSLYTYLILGLASFIAGFIDSIIGGGGLIQLPALLINLPQVNLPSILGTNKISAFSGTTVATYKYYNKIKVNFKLIIPISLCAIVFSLLGAKAISLINKHIAEKAVFVVLIILFIYTITKKELGQTQAKNIPFKKQLWQGCLLATIVGLYDGMLGPGTGSFLILGFILLLGFDFLHANAYAKIINCMTNFGALITFMSNGQYILSIAIVIASFNILGNFIGSHIALKKGNRFIKIFFICMMLLIIIKYGYTIWMNM